MHGIDNARLRPAAADIALQELNNLRRTWIGITLQQPNATHNHSGCAIGALKRAGIDKSLLHGMQAAVFLQAQIGRASCRERV